MPMRIRFTHTKPKISVAWATRTNKKLEAALMATQRANAEKMKRTAEKYSGGMAYPTYKTPGPYGFNPKRPPLPLPTYYANVHAGAKLLKGWRIYGPKKVGDEIRTYLYNIAPESRFFAGIATIKMRARPLLQKIAGTALLDVPKENQERWHKFWSGIANE